MKVIETVYNGYRFRSRLEARWAVFFDSLGIRYEYEKEGYDLDGTWYLPDFWLPEYKYWVEIKGEISDEEDLRKAKVLYQHTGYPTIIFFFEPACSEGIAYYSIENKGVYEPTSDSVEEHAAWVVCLLCDQIDINARFHPNDRLCNPHNATEKIGLCTCPPYKRSDKGIIIDANRTWKHQRLRDAEMAARSARFEFGEKGR